MSNGIHNSVKGYLNAQLATLSLVPSQEIETISCNVSAPQDSPPHPVEETTLDSTTYGLSICDGSISCFLDLSSAAESTASVNWKRPPRTSILIGFWVKVLMVMSIRGGSVSILKASKSGRGMAIAITYVKRKRLIEWNLRLRLKSEWNRDEHNTDWLTEVNCLGQLGSPNIVKLIGYCLKDDKQLLVYEFMPNGSLENHLYGEASHHKELSWKQRMKIAVGAAKVLAFLHSDEEKVIYGDFKTSKILLDSNCNAKRYGYGVSKEGFDGYRHAAHAFQHVVPSYEDTAFGYIPPGSEYVAPELGWRGEGTFIYHHPILYVYE